MSSSDHMKTQYSRKEYANLLWFGVIGSEKFNEDIEAPIRKYNNA